MNAGAPSPKVEEHLLPGTRLIVRRRAYFHHGIYVGNGRVIHYAGWFHSARGLIEEVTLERFTEGRPFSIGRIPADRNGGNQIVRRARARLGERSYHLLRNNCEHFCNWCQLGQYRSEQVEALSRLGLLFFGILQTLRATPTIFLAMVLSRAGVGMAAPMANVAAASPSQPHAQHHAAASFNLRDGARYNLGNKVGLFVDYKEMQPASGPLSALETGPRAMPPVRLGRFLVSAGIRVYLN